ncbi:hypothetical protein, partial [Roseibium sp.]|uniref:hypothetical protein n=1 Tax=Roseibium sp. TaxID=1936156 RepID=UPI003D09EAEB
ENNTLPNLQIRPHRANFLELRSQNPVASDVAAVDGPGYTHHQHTRQLPKSKKNKKTGKRFNRKILYN